MKNLTSRVLVCLSATLIAFVIAITNCNALVQSNAPSFQWIQGYGTTSSDAGRGLSVSKSGSVYLSGHTDTSFRPSRKEVFLGSFDGNGDRNWIDTQVTNTGDTNNGISSDDVGNVYIASTVNDDVVAPNLGAEDIILKKYDVTGGISWESRLDSQSRDFGMSVEAEQFGGVYVTGYTLGELGDVSFNGWDGYLAKFDALGNHQWTRQFGTDSDDYGLDLSVDGFGNVYVSGLTNGALGSPNAGRSDVFVSKYDSDGTLLWTTQIGTPEVDVVVNSAVDELGNIFLTGTTEGILDGATSGNEDAFVSMIATNGNVEWIRQLGSTARDEGSGIAIDEFGTVHIGGMTQGVLAGENFGSRDAFIARYTKQGDLVDVQQFGTTGADAIWGVEADGMGNLYVSGTSNGGISGNPPHVGSPNAFLAKIAIVPEPSTVPLVLTALALLVSRRRTINSVADNSL